MSQAIDVSEAVAPIKQSRSWQFSIKGLLILMTICCTALAMIAFPPLFVIALLLALIALSIFSAVAMVYGRGWIRPFSIVCGISLFVFFIASFGMHIHSPEEVCIFFLVQFFVSVFVGFCGAAAHGYLKKHSGVVPIPKVPFLRKWLHNPEKNV